jgi:dephospho-CoA kinase
MFTAGLTGGLASGKSFVGKALAELGCHLIEADQLGHQALAPGGLAHDAVLREFGTVDRSLLAREVFANPERLTALNAIVHPAVERRRREIVETLPPGIAVYAAAILVEIGTFRNFDCLIVAHCSREQQIERALARPGATMEDVLARLDRQMPLAEKLAFADYAIYTGDTKEDTLRQTENVYRCLCARAGIKLKL